MKNKNFYILEGILLSISVFFAVAVIGYSTLSLVFAGLAFLLALYKGLSVLKGKNAKLSHKLKIVLNTFVILGLALFISIEIPIIMAARTDENPEADYLIVLGAGVNGTRPSLSLQNRIDAAYDYLVTYENAKVIPSGGQGPGEDITESSCIARELIAMGISEDRIIMEEKSTSTMENLMFSKEKIIEDGGDVSSPVAIVSSEYHLCRAKMMAKHIDIVPLGVAAETSYKSLMVNYFIREAAGVLYLLLGGY